MNREVRQLAWFIWRHWPPAKDWGRKLLWRWIDWNFGHAFIGYFKDRQERVLAVGIARPVMKAEDGYDYDAFDPEGQVVWIDLAIAPNKRLFQGLGVLLKKRFGERESMAFRRYPERQIRAYPFGKTMRHTLRKEISYGF